MNHMNCKMHYATTKYHSLARVRFLMVFNFLDNPVAFNARRSRLVSTFQLHAYRYKWGMPEFRGLEVLDNEG